MNHETTPGEHITHEAAKQNRVRQARTAYFISFTKYPHQVAVTTYGFQFRVCSI